MRASREADIKYRMSFSSNHVIKICLKSLYSKDIVKKGVSIRIVKAHEEDPNLNCE